MFNRNENEGIIRNVKLLKDAVDEIVVIDSSDPEKYKQLKNSLKNFKVKLFRTLPLGYADPLHYYGINKTFSQYVLVLDSDEEPSRELIKKIKKGNFLYNVYDVLEKDKNGRTLWYKPVLFVKDSINKITGIIHTSVEFNEKPKKFSQEAFVIHHGKPTRSSSINKNYMEIESYERPIAIYIEDLKKRRKFVGNLLSFTYNLPKPMNIYLTAFEIGLGGSIINNLQYGISNLNLSYVIPFVTKYNINKIKFFNNLSKEEQELRIKIAREIQECGGVIKYLGLDKDYIVENLTKTFKWDIPGVEAFRRLLLYRHLHNKPAYKFPY
jgi:hypothetical protein